MQSRPYWVLFPRGLLRTVTPAHRAAFVDLPAQGSLALRKVEIRLGLLVCLCELPDSARKCWNVQLLNPDVSVSLLALWERMQKSEPNLQPGLKLGAPQRWFCSPPLPAASVQATCVQLCGTNSSPRYCFCPSEASRFRCGGQTQHLGNNQSAVKCETMWSDLPVQSSSQCGLEKAERASERLGLERHVGVTGRARERREV